MATRKTPAKKAVAKKTPAKKTSVVDPLHGLAVDRERTRALAEVKIVVRSRKLPLFEMESRGVWLFGKNALRLMKAKRDEAADRTSRGSFSGLLIHALKGRPVAAASVAEDSAFVASVDATLAGAAERSAVERPYRGFAVLGTGAKKRDLFGLLVVSGASPGAAGLLADGEAWKIRDVSERALFCSADGFGSWSAAEVTALASATEMLRARCGSLYEVALCAGKGGVRSVPAYPVFWFGVSPLGNLVGVFSVRQEG
jgi:hypothetical protein